MTLDSIGNIFRSALHYADGSFGAFLCLWYELVIEE